MGGAKTSFVSDMSIAVLIFVAACSFALLMVPRRWAPLPLLVGVCYMTIAQTVEIGPFSFPVYRILLGVGLVRIWVQGERFNRSLNIIDKMVIAWAGWVFFANLFHEWSPGSGPVAAAGNIYNILLIYFLTRIWCRNLTEMEAIVKVLAVLLAPIALEMIFEKATGKNLFAIFGGVSELVPEREGRLRAQGPFRHAILAGTVGAVSFPLMVGIWNTYRTHAMIGMAACIVMILASASSGPVMSLLAAIFAVGMWHFRHLTRLARRAAVVGYLLLSLVMSRPPYYLIAEIDITGGSTGWHRAFLIEQTIKHLPEWWLFGTDHTRHWMPDQGIAWSEQHTDITNYYIGFGVFGGLPAMLLLIAILWGAFAGLGKVLRDRDDLPRQDTLMIWCMGSALFAHAVTSFSVAYFDQSMVFFWLTIAMISSLRALLEETACELDAPNTSGLASSRA